jgi:hypothetical protein
MRVDFDSRDFAKRMKNVVDYSMGFLDGVQKGKRELMENIGEEVLKGLREFIDANARLSPETLHHVYEWLQTGSPDARLFDIDYVATHVGLSFNSTFRQSTSVKAGSKVPFYNKAEVMEKGIPVVIRPVSSKVLVFEDNGETVFTKKPVTVPSPGGEGVQGSYQRVFEQFFTKYFRQSFLKTTGILDHLNNPQPFVKNLRQGQRGGKSVGVGVGYRWVTRRSM